MTHKPSQSLLIRKLAARVAVTFSGKSGRAVAPRVQALATLPITPGEGTPRGANSMAVRKLAARPR